jgi:predicted aldo/keto reductase-like oxidoreductase
MPRAKHLSRREFLRTASMVGGVSLLGAAPVLTQVSAHAEGQGQDTGTGSVPLRLFGKTGASVASLSLGGMFDIPSNQLLLKQALKYGVTYWDTADCYEGGNSERGIGQFLSKYPEVRKQLFIVSKSDARDPSGMTKLLTQSLERMKTGYIDLYFVHGISAIGELNTETKSWAEKAKSEGKIRFFGFSTHSNMEDCMLAAAKLGWIDGIMMTYNFRLMHTDKMKSAVDACVNVGIGLTAMKTQGGGSVNAESEAEMQMAGRFLKRGFTDKQAKLKAVWENPNIASICSQMPNLTILMSNIAAALDQTKLGSEELQLLDQFACDTSSGYCAGCATICESSLGAAPPIRDVMRCLMYFHFYGEKDRARKLFADLSLETNKDLFQSDFSVAERRCPQGLPIGKLMRQAVALLS